MSQFHQFPHSPLGNQQPTGGFSSGQNSFPPPSNQPPAESFSSGRSGFLPPANQHPAGSFSSGRSGFLSPGNHLPAGGFQSASLQPAGHVKHSLDVAQQARPFGVTIAAVTVAIIGCLNLLLTQLSLCGLSFISSLTNSLYSSPFTSGAASQLSATTNMNTFILGILYYCALGIAHLYMARGLWQRKIWGYWGVIGIEGCTILVQFVVLMSSRNGAAFFANVFIAVLMAGYLLVLEEVRKTFQVPF